MVVFRRMTKVRRITEPLQANPGEGTVVRRPCPSDAIGNALRRAFAPDLALPDHFARSLTALDTRR